MQHPSACARGLNMVGTRSAEKPLRNASTAVARANGQLARTEDLAAMEVPTREWYGFGSGCHEYEELEATLQS